MKKLLSIALLALLGLGFVPTTNSFLFWGRGSYGCGSCCSGSYYGNCYMRGCDSCGDNYGDDYSYNRYDNGYNRGYFGFGGGFGGGYYGGW